MLASNMHHKLSSNFGWIFDRFFFFRFLLDFDLPESWNFANRQAILAFFTFLLYNRFCAIFIDFGGHVSFQNPSKIDQKSIKNR